jgi:hypothetical protein
MRARVEALRLLLAGCIAFGCAHPRAQQTEARPQASAVRQAAATPDAPPAPVVPPTPVATSASAGADFAHDVRPILEKRCQPCHFEGGKMYERLPFDRAETIQSLGTKLFTRIKAEDEQAVIRRFLAQGS